MDDKYGEKWKLACRQSEMTYFATKYIKLYLSLTDVEQKIVRDMIDIYQSEDSSKQEQDMAFHTLMETLFPQ